MNETAKRHPISPENATAIKRWITDRGGVALWGSVDLSDLSWSVLTPKLTEAGAETPKPHWKAGQTPARVFTCLEDFEVVTPREVKRFHVAVRTTQTGRVKLTDASTRHVRSAVEKAGENAWYEFDYSVQKAVILVPDQTVLLEVYEPEVVKV